MTDAEVRAAVRQTMIDSGVPPDAADEGIDLAFHCVDQIIERIIDVSRIASTPKVGILAVSLATSLARERIEMAANHLTACADASGFIVREVQLDASGDA